MEGGKEKRNFRENLYVVLVPETREISTSYFVFRRNENKRTKRAMYKLVVQALFGTGILEASQTVRP